MSDPTEEALLVAAKAGDPHAFEQLYARHLPRLEAYLRLQAGALVRRKESISDLAQSVCLELLGELSSIDYRGEAAFRAWLYRAAERKILDRARFWAAEKRDAVRESPARAAGSTSVSGVLDSYRSFCTPSRAVAAREELDRVEAAFAGLPEHYRDVIVRARLLGLSHAEIAAELDKSEGAVRTLLCRALAELSERLQREDGST